MKIGVSSTGKNLEAMVDPRFGRCQYFIIVDSDTMSFETVSNESSIASGGAGIKAAENISRAGAEAVITGNVGPNAFSTLNAAGIKVYIGASGTVAEAVEKLKKGELKPAGSASVNSHFGMGGR